MDMKSVSQIMRCCSVSLWRGPTAPCQGGRGFTIVRVSSSVPDALPDNLGPDALQ